MRNILIATAFLLILFSCESTKGSDKLLLWYTAPAANWNEALPVGNGHSGAMIFGNPDNELLQLNENTLYSGEPSVIFDDIKVTPEAFDQVVSLLKSEEYNKANDIVTKEWLGRLHQYYQPLGDLHIENNKTGEISDYRRELNISDAIATTAFTQNGVAYTREIFASHPDNVIVIRIKSDQPSGIDLNLRFGSPHPTATYHADGNRLIYRGKAPGYVERRTFEQIEAWGDQYKHPELYDAQGNRKFDKRVLYGNEIDNLGMTFEAQLQPIFPDKGEFEISDSTLRVFNTDEVCFVLAQATSFNGYDKSPSREGIDPSEKAGRLIADAMKHNYRTLRKRHVEDYKSLFNRVSLELKSSEKQESLPTDERILQFAREDDPGLAALLFQFGRYLMISGSRPGGQPLNLQGMWNKEIIPPWNSGYTQNINAQMNYWPAEVTNLSESHEPLFTLIRELSETGGKLAKSMYNRRGWVAHHNTSIWREPVPNDNVPTASFWPMVQGWYGSHLWERYQFTDDRLFLQNEAYPIMKGAAEFFADWLVDDGEGNLVTPAGISPENYFITEDGKTGSLSMGPTMDMAIVRETFARTVAASEILDADSDLRAELNEKLSKLLPYRIGAKGQLQEWMHDFKEHDPKHRHFSHLYGFHPGNQITAETPDLFKAVETTLNLRGDEATGWSMGWKINSWARLQDGNRAYKIIKNLFNPVGFGDGKHRGGGLYKSMLDAHPPFQIDGNFGYTAGVAEMLLQSHAGYVQLLPALPDAWQSGKIRGVKARGNFELAIGWEAGRLQSATIQSLSGKRCKLRTPVSVSIQKGSKTVAESVPVEVMGKTFYDAEFETEKGAVYKVEIAE